MLSSEIQAQWVWLGSDLLLLSLLLSLSRQLLALFYHSFARGKGCGHPLYRLGALFSEDVEVRGGEWHGSSLSSKSTSCSSLRSDGTNLKHVAPTINSLYKFLGICKVAPHQEIIFQKNPGHIEGGEVEVWGRDGHCTAGKKFRFPVGEREQSLQQQMFSYDFLSCQY